MTDDPMAALKASLPPEALENFDLMERIKTMFYRTEREDRLQRAFVDLIRQSVERPDTNAPLSFENRGTGRGLVLWGPSRVGKTTALDRLIDENPALKGWRDPRSNSPMLQVSLPSPCTVVQAGRQLFLAASAGLPIHGDPPAHKLFELASAHLVARKKVFVRFNELQHATHDVSDGAQQVMVDALKDLMDVCKVSLVVNGVETLVPFLERDTQLKERVTIVPYPALEPDQLDVVEHMVETYAAKVGLTVEAAGDPDFYPRIVHGTNRALGLAIEVTRFALADALSSKQSRLTRDNYANVYARKTGQPASRNPFLADRYADIDTSIIVPKPPSSEPLQASKQTKPKKRTK